MILFCPVRCNVAFGTDRSLEGLILCISSTTIKLFPKYLYKPNYNHNMSFGYGVGDFLSLAALTLKLYKSFKGAPREFDEISRE